MQSYFKQQKSSLKEGSSSTGKNKIADEKEKIETEMQYLLFFLENADFLYLRDTYLLLSGIEDISVTLEIKTNTTNCCNKSGENIVDKNVDKKEDFDADINDFTILVNNHVVSVKRK